MKRKPIFRIRDSRGSYFKGMSGIGPRFGATFADAVTFDDGMEAYRVWSSFPAMVSADLVNEREQACDVKGRALKDDSQ